MNRFILVLVALICLVAQSQQQPVRYGSHLELTVLSNNVSSRCADSYILYASDPWSPFNSRRDISLPAGCLPFADPNAGHIARSIQKFSAAIPCCTDTPNTISFVEISFDGSVSAVQTLAYASPNRNVHSIVKEGNDLWFSAYDPDDSKSVGVLCYAYLKTGKITPLVEGTFFVQSIDYQIWVSNGGGMADGLNHVGTIWQLPSTPNPTLNPLLNQNVTVSWFALPDNYKYAYYAQTSPESLLIRCNPYTWEPLYNISVPAKLVNFVVAHQNDDTITIFGSLVSEGTTPYFGYAKYVDDGTSIIQQDFTNHTSHVKLGLFPSHCENNVRDYGEPDNDCGQSCMPCKNSQQCYTDSDCISSYCSSDKICTDTPPTVPFTPGNVLAINTPATENTCSNLGSIWEVSSDGTRVQQILLPSECQVYSGNSNGFITLSRNKVSAVIPCCFDPSTTDNTIIGFVELYADGTFSPVTTLQLPDKGVSLVNIVKDGNDIWLNGQRGDAGTTYYVNVTSGQVLKLVEDYLNSLSFVGDTLVTSSGTSGLLQIGTGLPKSENQVLTPLLNVTTSVYWFVHTDSYAYYFTLDPTPSLVRCDTHTWTPLYSVEVSGPILSFAVLYNDQSHITIVASIISFEQGSIAMQNFVDNGARIVGMSIMYGTEYYYYPKISSVTPSYPCENQLQDLDETDIDCGGSSCQGCKIGQHCLENRDCDSTNCEKSNSTCSAPLPPIAPPMSNPPTYDTPIVPPISANPVPPNSQSSPDTPAVDGTPATIPYSPISPPSKAPINKNSPRVQVSTSTMKFGSVFVSVIVSLAFFYF